MTGSRGDEGAPSSTAPLITVDNVSFAYPNGTHALANLSMTIEDGRIYGVVGPSGCGKSTLLHLLAGLSVPTEGTLTTTQDKPLEADRHFLTMVFQKDTLLPWLRVRENVKLFFRFHRHDRERIDERVDWLLRVVGLGDFADAYPNQLSGGMRRRVAFLSAIAPFPRVLLLDEPFSSLDEPTRVSIHQDVYNTLRELGMSAVVVTHDLGEAISLCDEIAILTARPATVSSLRQIPFGRERNILHLRQEPEFLNIYGSLWHDLSEQIQLGQNQDAVGSMPGGTK